MRFEILTAVFISPAIKPAIGICRPDECLLRVRARDGETSRTTILVYTGIPDDTFNIVVISYGLLESLDDDYSKAFATCIPIGSSIPHSTTPRGGEHAKL